MKIKLIFPIIFLFNYAFAQSTESKTSSVLPNIIPPSPTASSLGKFGDVPVSLATGIPNVSVPLYEVQSGKISVPITLNYHAGGIKVEEIAGWAGLGWALDCGGVITRSIRGIPDETAQGYFNTANIIPDPNVNYSAYQTWEPTESQLRSSLQGLRDFEPDQYFFNFMGSSGKLAIDYNKKVTTIPHKNFQIQHGFNTNNEWVIINEQGTKFIFGGAGAIETTYSESQCGSDVPGQPESISSWYLRKVISSVGDTVDFEYSEQTQSSYTVNRSFSKYDPIPGAPGACVGSNTLCYNTLSVSNIYLKKIKWRGGEIELSASLRQDFPDMYKLDKIVVKSKNGTILKNIDLTTAYFNSNDNEKRLKLTGVNVSDQQYTSTQHYQFRYNESINLPSRFSYQQDYWGYYNGKTANNTLIPIEPVDCLEGADRSPDSIYSRANILTGIKYPTGGSTTFVYEGHDYSYNNASLITTNELTQDQTASASARWNTNTYVETIFTVTNAQCGTVTVTRSKLPNPPNPDPLTSWVALIRLSDNQNLLPSAPPNGQSQPITLSPGQYKLIASAEDPANIALINVKWKEQISTTVQFKLAGGVRIRTLIDSITTGDVNKKEFIYRLPLNPTRSSGVLNSLPKYSYIGFSYNSSQGSGGTGIIYLCTFKVRQSALVNSLGSTQGSHISYSDVTVENRNGNAYNGKTTFNYTTARDYPDRGFGLLTFPFPPGTSYDWRRGLLLEEKTYNSGNTILKVTTNTYFFNSADSGALNLRIIPGIKVAYSKKHPIDPTLDEIVYKHYTTLGEWYYQKSSKTIQYDQNGLNSLITTVNSYYDNPLHAQQTRTITTQSDGKVSTTLVTYPDDYAAGTGFIDDMKSAHLTSLPIEQVSFFQNGSDTKISGGNITQYKTGGKGLPCKSFQLETLQPVGSGSFKFSNSSFGQLPMAGSYLSFSPDARYQEKLSYDQYDSKGNPTQITLKDGMSITYLWGYHQQYPVAEIKNATYQQVLNVLGQTTINQLNDNPGSDNNIHTLLNPLRSAFPQALVTTFTHKPLIGITSQTDAKGLTTTYEYDSFNRLMSVKDHQGNIIKHNVYHYQNQ